MSAPKAMAAVAAGPPPKRTVAKVLAALGQHPRSVYNTNRRTALVQKKVRAALRAELGDHVTPSAELLIDVIADQVAMFNDVSTVRAALGAAVVSRKQRRCYPIVQESRELAASLSQHLARFAELKTVTAIAADVRELQETESVIPTK